jgi:hypothetical protein
MSRTVRLAEAKCIICGETQNIEMHHIKGIKYLKGTSVHTTIMKRLNRIQVPLCKPHHIMTHQNGLMALLNDRTIDHEENVE